MHVRTRAIVFGGYPWQAVYGILSGVLLILLLGLSVTACGEDKQPASRAIPANDSKPLFETAGDAYASVLRQYVDGQGMVDYQALKENREPLDQYVQSLANLGAEAYEKWSPEEKVAFWINAYNGLTLQTIIDHYPIQKGGLISGLRFPENSIRQIPGVWDSVEHTVMGQAMTLDQIEHEILRKNFNEPRIHMALVCAAMGCPALRAEPYDGKRLDAQLDDQSTRFLADPLKFRVDRDMNKVLLSSIFKWFGADFSIKYQTDQFKRASSDSRPVLEFISRYVGREEAEYLKTQEHSIEYLDYDWSLNAQGV
jgi:hypothetical protein